MITAFYGVPVTYARYNTSTRATQWKTIRKLTSYRPPDVMRHLPQRNDTHELARSLQHVPTRLQWPTGGTEQSRFTRPPCVDEVRAFESAARRAAPGTPVTIRTVYLHNDSYRCSEPERLLTRDGGGDGWWQTFLCVERTIVDIDIEMVARCVVLSPPTEQEARDLQMVIDCLSLTVQGTADHHVVMHEAT